MVLIWHAAIALGLNTSPNQIDLTSLQSNLSNTYTRGLERIGEYGFDLK